MGEEKKKVTVLCSFIRNKKKRAFTHKTSMRTPKHWHTLPFLPSPCPFRCSIITVFCYCYNQHYTTNALGKRTILLLILLMIKIRGHTCVRSLFIKLNGKRDRSKDSKEECVCLRRQKDSSAHRWEDGGWMRACLKGGRCLDWPPM